MVYSGVLGKLRGRPLRSLSPPDLRCGDPSSIDDHCTCRVQPDEADEGLCNAMRFVSGSGTAVACSTGFASRTCRLSATTPKREESCVLSAARERCREEGSNRDREGEKVSPDTHIFFGLKE